MQKIFGNVDGQKTRWVNRLAQGYCFLTVSCAEFNHRAVRAHRARDLRRIGSEDRLLGASRVIGLQARDIFKER